MDSIQFEIIGEVKSCYPDKFGTPRQPGLVGKARAQVVFRPQFQPEISLEGLEGFSHVWILFVFHKNQNTKFHSKVHPPRLGGESIGVFATRSPHRPNPIGMSLVELIEVKKDSIVIAGADIVDGTPVVDIKPYLKEIESRPRATSGWSDSVASLDVQVQWTAEQSQMIADWEKRLSRQGTPVEALQTLIEETLKLDPRPLVYRGYEDQQNGGPYRQVHAVRFYDGDIHFQFTSPTHILITKVVPGPVSGNIAQ